MAEENEFNRRAYGYFATLPDDKLPAINMGSQSDRSVGYSGMAHFDSSSFLIVHDAKGLTPGPRLSVLSFEERNPRIEKVEIDWSSHGEPASDLEAVCRIPGNKMEFWAVESGYWEGKYGRFFKLSLESDGLSWKASIRDFYQLPANISNIEGIACLAQSSSPENKSTIMIASRGGDEEPATIIWGHVDKNSKSFKVLGERHLELSPKGFQNRDELRRCSELYLDSSGRIWGVATHDPGDTGPFHSYLYLLGEANGIIESSDMLTVESWCEVFPGLKVEALSRSPYSESDGIIGTDDEELGGIWRPFAPRGPCAEKWMGQ